MIGNWDLGNSFDIGIWTLRNYNSDLVYYVIKE
jgi:hypothetical protein